MEIYSSLSFFLSVFFFIAIMWLVSKKMPVAYIQYLIFFVTIGSIYFYFGKSSKRIFLFSLFYLLIIKLSLIYKNIPKKFFISFSLIPLLIFKLGDVVPVLKTLQSKIAFLGLSYVSFRVIQIILDANIYKPKRMVNVLVFLINPLTILAGPIDRFQRFEKNLEEIKTSLNVQNLIKGWMFLLVGIFQKFILGYYWDLYVVSKFTATSFAMSDVVGTAYTYTVYLFLDFSGYSLMAMGLGYMMGILLPHNFDRPWLTKNPQDLWRRFHITLGTFLNDYFFKPIYMELMRKNFFKAHRLLTQNLSLFLTFLLMGAWNGLKWNYILSGAMFGLASVVYNIYQAKFKKSQSLFLKPLFIPLYRFIFLNYVVWALYFFSGKLPI